MESATQASDFAQSGTQVASISKGSLWTGRVMSGLVVAFLAFDGVLKFFKPAPVVDAFAQLGWPMSLAGVVGAVLLLCTVLYVIPRTSVLGAILLTGYLGGAVVAHVRVGNPLFSHILFPVYLGVLLWGGLYLRERRLRQLIPFRAGNQGPVSKAKLWTGRILSALPVLLLLFSGVTKVMKAASVVQGFAHLGFPESVVPGIGILEIACVVVYLIPATDVLGAILLAGYMGGATATSVRIGDPMFFAPAIMGVLFWAGLFLRENRLRALIPLRS
jgi:DoxX-like family